MITLEFVCTGNEERSVSAEAVAKYMTQQGDYFTITSSGTHVDRIKRVLDGDLDDTSIELSVKKKILHKAFTNSALGSASERDVKEMLDYLAELDEGNISNSELRQINRLYAQAKKAFTPYSHSQLTRAFSKYGIKFPTQEPRQFQPRKGVDLVLGMGDSNARIVSEVYEGKVDSFHNFIGVDALKPVVMQTDPAKFDEFAQRLYSEVPRVLEKVHV